MAKAVDLTGQRFGRQTVVREVPKRGRCRCWLVICDCGTEKEVLGQALTSGHTKSCGCLRRESGRVKHGHARKGKRSREYQAWRNAIGRCHHPSDRSFKDYGAKGVIVCAVWRNDFSAFFSYMGDCPEGYSLDRIDPTGNYEPGNCRWILKSKQNGNRRNCRYFEYGGERLIKADWERRLGLSRGGLGYWLRKGYTIADVYAQRGMPPVAELPLAA